MSGRWLPPPSASPQGKRPTVASPKAIPRWPMPKRARAAKNPCACFEACPFQTGSKGSRNKPKEQNMYPALTRTPIIWSLTEICVRRWLLGCNPAVIKSSISPDHRTGRTTPQMDLGFSAASVGHFAGRRPRLQPEVAENCKCSSALSYSESQCKRPVSGVDQFPTQTLHCLRETHFRWP